VVEAAGWLPREAPNQHWQTARGIHLPNLLVRKNFHVPASRRAGYCRRSSWVAPQFDLIAQHDHDAIFWVRRRRGQRFGEPSMDAHTPRSELGHCNAGIVSALNDSDLAILDVLTREGSALRPAHRRFLTSRVSYLMV
jgi:hypothetical protein